MSMKLYDYEYNKNKMHFNKEIQASKNLQLQSQQLTHYLQDWSFKQQLMSSKKSKSSRQDRYTLHNQNIQNKEKFDKQEGQTKEVIPINHIGLPPLMPKSKSSNKLRSQSLLKKQQRMSSKGLSLEKGLLSIKQQSLCYDDKHRYEAPQKNTGLRIKDQLLQAAKRRKRKMKKVERPKEDQTMTYNHISDSIQNLKSVFLSKYLQRKLNNK